MTLQINHYSDIDWHVPVGRRDDIDWKHVPGPDEPGRKFLVDGDGGFYLQAVRLPPGFDAPMHSHSHAEVFMVAEGSCTFNGTEMRPFDSLVVHAGAEYGFTAGDAGVTFLVTRLAAATFQGADERPSDEGEGS